MSVKRPVSYLLGFVLVILVALVAWIHHALNAPEIQEAVRKKKGEFPGKNNVPPIAAAGPPPAASAATDVDPMHLSMADELHSESNMPARDLEIIRDFITIYGRAVGANPVGENTDITAALTGAQYPGQKGQIFPRGHRAIRAGQLVDRWGTPFWFHPNSGSQMEIRSAGPDRQLFTPDDVVLNPSPAGLGATPGAQP